MIAEAGLAIAQIGTQILSMGEKAGIWDIGKMLGLRPEKTTAGNDPEYIQAVRQEMQREYDIAQKALSVVNPNDTEKVNFIISAYDAEKLAWGDPSNPNRNVANPAGFKSSMQDIIDNYTYDFMDYSSPLQDAFDPTQVRDLGLGFQDIIDILSGKSKDETITEESIKQEADFYNQGEHQAPAEKAPSLNILAIGGLCVIGLMILARR